MIISLYIIFQSIFLVIDPGLKLRLGGEYVTDEMLGCAGESRNGFLCTCEGVEFLEYIKNINFSFSIVFFFSTFRLITTEFKFASVRSD